MACEQCQQIDIRIQEARRVLDEQPKYISIGGLGWIQETILNNNWARAAGTLGSWREIERQHNLQSHD